jgi:hypothetical protein
MPDPNKICGMCTNGENSDEFTLCPGCHDKLANGWVGGNVPGAMTILSCQETKKP